MIVRTLKSLCLMALLLTSGCATLAPYTGNFREGLASRDYEGVLRGLDGARKGPNRLLYFMEKGLVDHNRGDYRGSNASFEQAERLADRLFTRSLSREAASLITSDAVRAYRGEAFELIFIHYYRALNYWRLGLAEDALVECRKANLKLSAAGTGDAGAYRNDAFIHYLTGLFYEATGERNDAYVSYRDAQKAYRAYAETFGIPPPPALADDLARVSESLGYGDETETLLASLSPPVGEMASGHLLRPSGPPQPPGYGELILFCEAGFVPRKVQEEINLPIFNEDMKRGREIGLAASGPHARKGLEGLMDFSRKIAARQRPVYPADLSLKYWLRVALPAYREAPPATRSLRLTAAGQSVRTVLAEDLSAIARRTFEAERPTLLVRTVARGVSKYLLSEAAEKKNKYLGLLTNLFTAATETADTRSWVTLPHSIQIGRLRLPPGIHDITVESMDAGGRVIETTLLPGVEIRAGERTFLSCRTYK
ncbi:MAG: hypothetical protein EXS64_19575 [Candidatus Latescibacteria bacterium]|nr:hypothetical protein [Candidatus Latescibacterota bacterium]